MNEFYIHYTGFFLTYVTIPSETLPYLLSTESSFYYPMLQRYYKRYYITFCTPFSKHNHSFNAALIEHFDYYLQAKSPVSINSLLRIKYRSSEYLTNMINYNYLLN